MDVLLHLFISGLNLKFYCTAYRNNGILSYIQVGGKILYRTSDVQRTIMSGFKEAYRLKDDYD